MLGWEVLKNAAPLPQLLCSRHRVSVLVRVAQLEHAWCFPAVSSGTSTLLPRPLLPPPRPLPFPFLAPTPCSSAFPKALLFPWFPSLYLFPPRCLFFPFFLPHPFPVLLPFTYQLKGISSSLLTLSCLFLGGTMGICQALQLSHFSRPKPPLGPSWCGRASANLGILSCPSSLTGLSLGLMLHQLGQPVLLGPGSRSHTSRSCVR